ncbi:hypothetical protein Q5H93_14895 [Hymenobacter sp. ASUV-10]|uniref:DUF4145 domain-containing protein n=1 Tax=Hymenobacter aranciens TaxID=3063996 RepID=A0ABT9BCP5_9BACT|nr:hypothetical protein [Hymenobacter sp. ASUV-10]MDO7876029.1 hypothetical protein [Hymenobacter sp. ASUV-10]
MSRSKKQENTPYESEYSLRDIPDSDAILEMLKEESDRGAILIFGAYLEELLGVLIAELCVSNSLADSILKVGTPAGDFDSRILLASALGLIRENEVKALRIIQRIRNKAAHFDRSGRGFNVLFDSDITVDQIVELTTMFGYDRLVPDRKMLRNRSLIRSQFQVAGHHLATRLLMRRLTLKRITLPQSPEEQIAELTKEYEGSVIGERLLLIKSEHPDPHEATNYSMIFREIILKGNEFSISPELIVAQYNKYLVDNNI